MLKTLEERIKSDQTRRLQEMSASVEEPERVPTLLAALLEGLCNTKQLAFEVLSSGRLW